MSKCVDLSPAGTINRWCSINSPPANVEVPLMGPFTVPTGDSHHLTELIAQVGKGASDAVGTTGTIIRAYYKLSGASQSFVQVDEIAVPEYGVRNIQWGTAMRFKEGESWKFTIQQSIPTRLALKVSGQSKKYDLRNTPAVLPLLDQLYVVGDDFTLAAFNGAVRPNYGECIVAAHPGYAPSWFNGGIAGMTAVTYWASQSAVDLLGPMRGFKYIGLSLGLNDLVNGNTPTAILLAYINIVKRLISRDFTPIVATLPYYAPLADRIFSLNKDLLQYASQFNIPAGPDLYSWFSLNPSGVASGTPVVPTAQGKVDTIRLWAQTMDSLYT